MGVVPEETINQFAALMEEGLLLLIFILQTLCLISLYFYLWRFSLGNLFSWWATQENFSGLHCYLLSFISCLLIFKYFSLPDLLPKSDQNIQKLLLFYFCDLSYMQTNDILYLCSFHCVNWLCSCSQSIYVYMLFFRVLLESFPNMQSVEYHLTCSLRIQE